MRARVESSEGSLRIRRALISVSDKTGIVRLGRALADAGAEIIATGNTANVLKEAGLKITPIEQVSGVPEAFQGRMKTLSFPVFSGILYRRNDPKDEQNLKELGFASIDCVVVNFYPFEKAAARDGIFYKELVEEIDIGGPALVRAGAKNAPDVLVLTDPAQYEAVIGQLNTDQAIGRDLAMSCASRAWARVLEYDAAIAERFGEKKLSQASLRYGENPHQKGFLELLPNSPIAWPGVANKKLTKAELSYNNILDLSAGYALTSDLIKVCPDSSIVVIVKHNNPCGVAAVPKSWPGAQLMALTAAWEGDSVSAFGGVVVFSDPIESESGGWLSERFVELVSAPELSEASPALGVMLSKRKNLKAVSIRRFGEGPKELRTFVPGAVLVQTADQIEGDEDLRSVTKIKWPEAKDRLARFGIAICKALKSNALAMVREMPGVGGALQLVGAGQGQPNRVEALERLAIPRAQTVLGEGGNSIGVGMCDVVLVSDAFFPFRDTVDVASRGGIRFIVQPGGSIKDRDSIAACDRHGIAMVFTGVRHFRH